MKSIVDSRQEELPTAPEVLEIVEKRFADHERDPATAMTLDEFKLKFHLSNE